MVPKLLLVKRVAVEFLQDLRKLHPIPLQDFQDQLPDGVLEQRVPHPGPVVLLGQLTRNGLHSNAAVVPATQLEVPCGTWHIPV